MLKWIKGLVRIPMYVVGYILFIPYFLFVRVPYHFGGGNSDVWAFERFLFPFIEDYENDIRRGYE